MGCLGEMGFHVKPLTSVQFGISCTKMTKNFVEYAVHLRALKEFAPLRRHSELDKPALSLIGGIHFKCTQMGGVPYKIAYLNGF